MAEAKTNAMRILEKAKISYTAHAYQSDDGAIDGVAVAKKVGRNPETVFKTLVTKGKSGGYLVFVIPVAHELDLKKAAKAAGEKSVEMIPVKEINKVTGYIRGGCSPVGMKKLYPTVIHTSAKDHPEILVSGGRIGLQIEIAPELLAKASNAVFEDIILGN